jgi:hypothetical protein
LNRGFIHWVPQFQAGFQVPELSSLPRYSRYSRALNCISPTSRPADVQFRGQGFALPHTSPHIKAKSKKGSRLESVPLSSQGKTVEGRFRVRNLTRFPAPDTRFCPPRLTSSLFPGVKTRTYSCSRHRVVSLFSIPSAKEHCPSACATPIAVPLRIRNSEPSSESSLAFCEQRFRATLSSSFVARLV